MDSNKKTARIAGLLYFLVVLTGIFGIMYVPSKLLVMKNAAATFNNIVNGEQLFRLSIASTLMSYIIMLIIPFVLYKLLMSVNKNMAVLMVTLGMVSAILSFIPVSYKMDIITLVSDADYLNIYSREQLQSKVMLSLASYYNGTRIAMLFWGLWLFPFGYLVFKSGILPKFLGVFLMLGCLGYLIHVFGRLIFLSYSELAISSFVTLPATIGELGICLWLLIMGAKEKSITVN